MSAPLAALDVERATNLFGPLSDDVKLRLQAVVADPTDETWDDASSVILNGHTGTTLWQAVIAVDLHFPRSGPMHHGGTSVRGRWAAIPSRETLLAALRYGVDPPEVTCLRDPGRPDGPSSYHHGPHTRSSSCDHPEPIR